MKKMRFPADRPGGAAASAASSAAAAVHRPPLGTRAGVRANAAAAVLTAVGSLAEAWALIVVARVLAHLVAAAPAAGGAVVWEPSMSAYLWHQLGVAAVAALACALCAAAVHFIAQVGAATEEGALRRQVLAHLFELGPAQASDRSGATVTLLTDGAERVAVYRQTFLVPTIAAIASPLLVLGLVGFLIDPLSACVLALAFVAVPALIVLLHRRLRRSSAASRAQRMRLSAEYLDAIQGLTTLVLARAAERRAADLEVFGEANRRAVMRLLAGNQLVILITDGLFSLFLVTASAALALSRLATGAIGLDGALALVLTSFILLQPLDRVGGFFYVGMGGMANQRAMRRVLARRRPAGSVPEYAVGEQTGFEPTRSVATTPGGRGATPLVSLRGVAAAWPPRPEAAPGGHPGGPPAHPRPGRAGTPPGRTGDGAPVTVLTGIDLEVAAGEHLAVVGPSGAGKSTLMALIAGDLLPASGIVRVAGVVSAAATQDAIRSASAVVTQTTWLFTGTVADNLRLADPTATEERMWQALAAANLADEVRALPEGLHTDVGERGSRLSGGQAQRLSLARAFLADRPLLLLDEPTSQVDLAGEAQIIDAIERLSAGRTVITVSHRAAALTHADRVVTVKDGGLR
ncbi:ABC transporter ATP-binding protein/permease [Actinomyces sp.]|uniref:ABC transporter ATP-binding protein/permease n=1 Tax=Actinomyces sp. TaxID=29317 RepID=UPI0026DC018D|nr:ABC transporter ATP-binding protein [Actinomyces sp.]MDO4900137.1 ABC transporter ATP-binding protein [Actinomyces sp.]